MAAPCKTERWSRPRLSSDSFTLLAAEKEPKDALSPLTGVRFGRVTRFAQQRIGDDDDDDEEEEENRGDGKTFRNTESEWGSTREE